MRSDTIQWAENIPSQENALSLTQNPEITRLAEMMDFKR